jgi:hypothetical protein
LLLNVACMFLIILFNLFSTYIINVRENRRGNQE